MLVISLLAERSASHLGFYFTTISPLVKRIVAANFSHLLSNFFKVLAVHFEQRGWIISRLSDVSRAFWKFIENCLPFSLFFQIILEHFSFFIEKIMELSIFVIRQYP